MAAYQKAMRRDLWSLIEHLSFDGVLSLAERERSWKLAILLARELGADVEEPKPGKVTSIGTVPHDAAAPEF